MQTPATFESLITEAQTHKLYVNLVKQLNKDFKFANIPIDFEGHISPSNLKKALHETIYSLIHEKFAEYLNLLYIVDVPEHKIKQLDGSNILKLSQDVSVLILWREWQKVKFRQQYSQK